MEVVINYIEQGSSDTCVYMTDSCVCVFVSMPLCGYVCVFLSLCVCMAVFECFSFCVCLDVSVYFF